MLKPIGRMPHDSLVLLRNEREAQGKLLPYDEAAGLLGVTEGDVARMMDEILVKQGDGGFRAPSKKTTKSPAEAPWYEAIPRPSSKARAARRALIIELSKKGISFRQIAKRVGVSPPAVARMVNANGHVSTRTWLSVVFQDFGDLPDELRQTLDALAQKWPLSKKTRVRDVE